MFREETRGWLPVITQRHNTIPFHSAPSRPTTAAAVACFASAALHCSLLPAGWPVAESHGRTDWIGPDDRLGDTEELLGCSCTDERRDDRKC
jgi:hypothetical protein